MVGVGYEGSGFRGSGLGFRVQGLGFRFRFRFRSRYPKMDAMSPMNAVMNWLRFWGLGFRVLILEFRV